MKTSYSEGWSLFKKKPIRPMDADEARRRHESREPYVALLGDNQPSHVIDMAGDWVSVIFLDRNCRQYLRYDFKEKKPSQLFLKGAIHWQYRDAGEQEVSSKLFNFSEDGYTVMEERNLTTGEVTELETTASVDANWEPYPFFGDYASLCREDR